jgi:hypothetical protein
MHPEDFARPDGLVERQVCGDTRMRPGAPLCWNDIFFTENAPKGIIRAGPQPTAQPSPTADAEPTAAPAQQPPPPQATAVPQPKPQPTAVPPAQPKPTQPPAPPKPTPKPR